MMQTLENCNLVQHVKESTYPSGHTLDVLICRDESTLIIACDDRDIGLSDNNGDLINSHNGITCKLNCQAKHSNSKLGTFRRLKTIDVARFEEERRTLERKWRNSKIEYR